MRGLNRHFMLALVMLLALASPWLVGEVSAQPVPVDPAASVIAPAVSPTAQGQPVQSRFLQAPPVDFVAPALPDPNDTNAQRAKSQPGNNAPLWRAVRNSGNQPGVVSSPGGEKEVLIQRFVRYPGAPYTSAGEAWRQVRNNWLIPYGSALLIIVVLGFAIMYLTRGTIGKQVPEGGRLIERFTPFERAAHWANATAFVVLALSGVVMAFGKFFLLPIIGATLFGWLSLGLKTAHNFVGPLFVVSLLVVLLTFIRDNFWNRADTVWLKRGGGMLRNKHVPAGRFNAGEKLVFWFGVLLLGFTVIGSGLVLDQLIPGMAYTRGDMQIAHMVHNVAAVLMMGMFIGHIYLGTIGMKGAYRAMRDGYVDENWARAHHDLWAEDIAAGRVPAQRSAPPVRPIDPALVPTGAQQR